MSIFDVIKSGRMSLEEASQYLYEESGRFGSEFIKIAEGEQNGLKVIAYRNNAFLVQVFPEDKLPRISINKTEFNEAGDRWNDGITWDEIQEIKNRVGFKDMCAVEIYPPQEHLVDVANIRHIWILPDLPDFMWRR